MHDRNPPTLTERVEYVLTPYLHRAGLTWKSVGHMLGTDMGLDELERITYRVRVDLHRVFFEAWQVPTGELLAGLDTLYATEAWEPEPEDASAKPWKPHKARVPRRRGPVRIRKRESGTD
jgi:hypothetical protein